MEVLVNWFTNTLGQHISREMVIFIISMIPILELRGGLLAASLLNISMVKAIPICILGNIIPIPFILLFIKQIFKWLKKTKIFRGLIIKMENRAMGKSDQIKSDGMKITQAFTREEENAKIYNKLNTKMYKSWMKAQYTSNLVWFSVNNISTWVVGAMYLVGFSLLGPAVQIGTLIAISAYAWRFWQPILQLSNLYNTFINAVAYLERIFEMIDEPVLVDDAPDATELPPIKGDVTFDDVTFSYDGSINVLEHFNLDVKAGESIALVGPTGAGKTTVVNLISRFYNINSGRVLVDGHDISKVTLHSLRAQMGIMLQDSFIFSGTIMDNIRYGRLDATDEEIIAAAKTVRAHEFISEMPDGYYTQVNERGSRLSQGQKQLIAFARTLLSDPKILVLDEATSSIDAKTERLLQEGLQALLKGRTSFIIAHRLSTIKNCDRILYISNKGIAESGSHDELMEQKGHYYQLYTAQLEE